MLQSRAAIDLTPLAVGGDTRGFTVSQVFSTVGSTAEPGEPQPCGQVPSASQWFVYQAQMDGMLGGGVTTSRQRLQYAAGRLYGEWFEPLPT